MPRIVIIYSGWIGAKEIDQMELEAMGVEISGNWNPIGAFDYCRMTADVYDLFKQRWKGRGVWGLIPRRTEVPTAAELKALEDEDVPF